MRCNLMTRRMHFQCSTFQSIFDVMVSPESAQGLCTVVTSNPRHSIHAHSINSCSADCNCRYGAHGEPYASGHLRVRTDHETLPRNFVPGNATWPHPSEPDETRLINRGVPGNLDRMCHVSKGIGDKSMCINSRDIVDG
jgi:hypothetical protein